MVLRPATQNDVDHLFAIHREALKSYVDATWGWDENWQAAHFRDNFDPSIRQVISYADEDVGFLDLIVTRDAAKLENIEIAPRYQGRGIGTKLIRRIISDAENMRIPVRLQVLKVNPRARALYQRMGFVQIGQTENHFQMERLPTG